MLKDHCNLLSQTLKQKSHVGRVLFAFLCVERLRFCGWAFEKEYHHDLGVIRSGCNFIFDRLCNENSQNTVPFS